MDASARSTMMSNTTMDVRSVGSCVSAVVTAFHDSLRLVQRIRGSTDEKSDETEMENLENSLMLGPPVVQGQYDVLLHRLGNRYENGDQTSREALKDILINLQLSLLATLRMALLDNIPLDYTTLQTTSDENRVKAMMSLFHLGQRIDSNVSPRASLTPEPLSPTTTYRPDPPVSVPSSTRSMSQCSTISPVSPITAPSRPISQAAPISPTSSKFPYDYPGQRGHEPRISGINLTSANPGSSSVTTNGRSNSEPAGPEGAMPKIRERPEKSMSVYSASIYSVPSPRSSRIMGPADHHLSSTPTNQSNNTPLPPTSETNIPPSAVSADTEKVLRSSSAQLTRTTSNNKSNHSSSTTTPTERQSSESGKSSRSISISRFKWRSPSLTSSLTNANRTSGGSTTSSDLYLPSEENNLSGFCKGAWKLQNGINGAFGVDTKPIGMFMASASWRCSKCDFLGPIHQSSPADTKLDHGAAKNILSGSNRARRTFDQSVHLHGPSGNRYRWVFLAKHHAPYKSTTPLDESKDGTAGRFGCIFCCSQNRGPAPIFGNLDTFMAHLREHGGTGSTWDKKKPADDLLDWTKCIIGRVPAESEDFELSIPTAVGIDGSGVL